MLRAVAKFGIFEYAENSLPRSAKVSTVWPSLRRNLVPLHSAPLLPPLRSLGALATRGLPAPPACFLTASPAFNGFRLSRSVSLDCPVSRGFSGTAGATTLPSGSSERRPRLESSDADACRCSDANPCRRSTAEACCPAVAQLQSSSSSSSVVDSSSGGAPLRRVILCTCCRAHSRGLVAANAHNPGHRSFRIRPAATATAHGK
mmetsp:Transcript_13517/g.39154  ORF Transcript_13517/g.39154 Transcript_13517/m.39154 type:complete len:204 (-) Transcript_13517:23-634(-)